MKNILMFLVCLFLTLNTIAETTPVSNKPVESPVLDRKKVDPAGKRRDGSAVPEQIAPLTVSSGKVRFASLGLGVTRASYSQTIEAPYTSDLNFNSLNSPSISFGYVHPINAVHTVSFHFLNATIAAKSGLSATITDDSIPWRDIQLIGSYTFNQQAIDGLNWHWNAYYGLQNHTIPFLRRVSATSVGLIGDDITMALGGVGFFTTDAKTPWNYELSAKLHVPVINCDAFDISSPFFLSVDIKAEYHFHKKWLAGVKLNTYMQAYTVENAPDGFSAGLTSGEQTTSYSLLEFIVGYKL